MKPLDLRRHQNIIAFKDNMNDVTAFHAYNLEIAEVSAEAFAMMTPVPVTTGAIPQKKSAVSIDDAEALKALEDWDQEIANDVKNGALKFGIRALTININQICNLKCAYCAAGGDGSYGEPTNQISVEKTLPQLKFFLAQLKPNQKFSITFVGGEPLLHPQAISAVYHYVVDESKNKQITPSFSIVTNGTLLKDKTLEIIKSMKLHITISIDGDKKYNDVSRPSKDGRSSTDMTVVGIKNILADRGSVESIGLSAVCSLQNPHMFESYQFLKQFNPDWMEFNFAYSEPSKDLQATYITEMNLIAADAWKNHGEAGLRQIKQFDHYFKLLDSQQRIENHCGAGKTYLMMDAKNRLYTCPWVVGEKDEVVGVGEQLDHDKLSKYSKSLIELNNCQSCWARHLCGGGCMYIHRAHTGDKHKKDDLFCERTRSLILTTIMYYKLSRTNQ